MSSQHHVCMDILIFLSWVILRNFRLGSACSEYLVQGDEPVLDSMILSSSHSGPKSTAHCVRMDSMCHWAAGRLDNYQWIQIDLWREAQITAVELQCPTQQIYVTSYKLSYSNDGWNWTYVTDDQGLDHGISNGLQCSNVVSLLPYPITATHVRLSPYSWKVWISLHFDLIGCYGFNVTFVNSTENNIHTQGKLLPSTSTTTFYDKTLTSTFTASKNENQTSIYTNINVNATYTLQNVENVSSSSLTSKYVSPQYSLTSSNIEDQTNFEISSRSALPLFQSSPSSSSSISASSLLSTVFKNVNSVNKTKLSTIPSTVKSSTNEHMLLTSNTFWSVSPSHLKRTSQTTLHGSFRTDAVVTEVNTTCSCLVCFEIPDVDKTALKTLLSKIILDNKIPYNKTSHHRRSKVSVFDHRISSNILGCVAVTILISIFGFFVSGDVLSLYKAVRKTKHQTV